MKAALSLLASLVILLVLVSAALLLPGQATLEVYDVRDIVYTVGGPWAEEITLSSPTPTTNVNPVEHWTQQDLAEECRSLVPGADKGAQGRSVQAQNGILIVRATAAQHLAVRGRLALARAWISLHEE